MKGSQIIARSLKNQGVTCVFGVVGIPVIEIAEALMQEGIEFVAMRNEQAASVNIGFIVVCCKRVGIPKRMPRCFIDSFWAWFGSCIIWNGKCSSKLLAFNCDFWFKRYRSSASGGISRYTVNMIKELNQVEIAKPFCKMAAKPGSLSLIPFIIEKAFRTSLYGRPGVSYIDIPVMND